MIVMDIALEKVLLLPEFLFTMGAFAKHLVSASAFRKLLLSE
jgi:hypothetical protein